MLITQRYPHIFQDTQLFDEPTIAKIHHLIVNHCHYGKDFRLLLDPAHGFRTHYHQDMILFENYLELDPDSRNKMRGACWPLAMMAGRYLQDDSELSERYRIGFATGQCPPFFASESSSHNYLVMWPKSREEEVRQALEDRSDGRIPEDCLLVGPSFKLLGTGKNTYNFTLSSIDFTFDTFPVITSHTHTTLKALPFNEGTQTPIIPIGYLQDIIFPRRTVPSPLQPHSMISLLFVRENKQAIPIIELAYQNETQPQLVHWHSWRSDIPAESLAARWIEHMQSDLQKPPNTEIFDQYNDNRHPGVYPHILIPKTQLS